MKHKNNSEDELSEYCQECEQEVEPRDVRRRLKVSGQISHQLRCPNCDSFLGAGHKTFYNGEEFVTKKVGGSK